MVTKFSFEKAKLDYKPLIAACNLLTCALSLDFFVEEGITTYDVCDVCDTCSFLTANSLLIAATVYAFLA